MCCAEMVKPGDLPEPTTAEHLARLVPRKRPGSKMSEKDLHDPAKAKYIGLCCGGTRVWGDGNPSVYMDAYAFTARPEHRLARLLPRPTSLTSLSPVHCFSCVLPAQKPQRFCRLCLRQLQGAFAVAVGVEGNSNICPQTCRRL